MDIKVGESSGLESEVELLSDVVTNVVVLFLVVDELQFSGEVDHITAHVVVILYLVEDHLSLRSSKHCLIILLSTLLSPVSGVCLCEVPIGLNEETVVFILSEWFCIEVGPWTDVFFLDGESFIVVFAFDGVGAV